MNIEKVPFRLFESFETTPKGAIRRRTLRFDLNALADFEQEVGMGFAQLMKSRAIFASARAMLWAGLKHEDPTLTIPGVGDLLTQYVREGGSVDVALQTAFRAAVEQGALGKVEVIEPSQDEASADPKSDGDGPALVAVPMPSDS